MRRVSAFAIAVSIGVLALAGAVSGAKDCVFLHGAGNLNPGPPTSSFTDYWGDIASYTPQCASWTFNHADTVTMRFDNETLTSSYCDVASGGTGVISNAIIFTHSMGNNILAEALREGVCRMDSSATWYLSAPPAFGSKAADMIETICDSQSWLDAPIRDLAVAMHYCQSDQPGPANEAYVSLQTTDPAIAGLADVMAAHASGSMCGNSAFGLFSKYSLELEALSDLVGFGQPNDGMVGFNECTLSANITYGGDASDPFYNAAINHADATCRNGNGDFGDDRQPCKWFSLRT
jgi:hypothetical protein